jgi:hypothetical protein
MRTEFYPYMGSWISELAKSAKHSIDVNVSVAKKALTPGRDVRRAAALVSTPFVGPLSYFLLSEDDKKKIKHSVAVNTSNLQKTVKSVSLNKIVDGMTATPILPEDSGAGDLIKWLPLVAAGVGAITLLMGE